MKVYNYNDTTGEYWGETEAQESPLEPGVYLIPANAVTIKPKVTAAEGEALIWKDEKWQVVPDNREKEIIIFSSETEYRRLTSQGIELQENTYLVTEKLEKALSSGEHLKLIDGKIVIEPKTEKELAEERIRELKSQLSAGDYKITKNAEAIAADIACPYPAQALQAERQAMREEINKLEMQLKDE